MITTEIFDLTVIGGGPVGIFGATMGGLHGMKVKILETLSDLGGQLYALYPEKPIYDVAGFPMVIAKELTQALIAQMQRYDPVVCTEESVESVESSDEGIFLLRTHKGMHATRAILLAVGIGSFTPRKLPVPGAEEYEGRGIYYFVPKLQHFTGQRVLVVGGGDTAVDWALSVSRHAREVNLVHRRNAFRALKEGVRQLHETPNITVNTPCEVAEILGEGTKLTGAVIQCQQEKRTVAIDSIIGGLGFHPNLGPLKTWNLDMANGTIKVSSDSMATNRPGIFAVGDAVSYPGKVKLIAAGFGEVGIAIAKIRSYLHPELSGLPHSSNMKQSKMAAEIS